MYKQSFIAVLLVVFVSGKVAGQEASNSEASADFVPSRLLENVVKGNFDEIESALTVDNENIDLTNGNGWSAARFAVSGGDLDMLNFLIKHEIDLNNADTEGVTPLMVAAGQADKDMVETLLAANASPLLVASDGSTAHSIALTAGRKVVALLIAEASILHGMESGDSKVVLQALEDGAYVNIRNPAGWTPLIYATHRGELETVKAILNFGADANRNENDGWTALHFAATAGNKEIVEALIKANTDYTIRNHEGHTARDKAAEYNNQEVVDIIPANPAQDL